MNYRYRAPFSQWEYRLYLTDAAVLIGMVVALFSATLPWAGPGEQPVLWRFLLYGVGGPLVLVVVWGRLRARLARADTPRPPWWLAFAVSLVGIGPAVYLAGIVGAWGAGAWLSGLVFITWWLAVRYLAPRLFYRNADSPDTLA